MMFSKVVCRLGIEDGWVPGCGWSASGIGFRVC